MNLRKLSRVLLSAVSSATFVGGLCFFDGWIRELHLIEEDTLIAEQMFAQAETLALYAKSLQEPDPMAWAFQFLSVGPEIRPIYVWSLNFSQQGGELESPQFDRNSGIFSFSKVLFPEAGTGIKVQFHHGYIGFLGTRNQWANDILIILLFIFLFSSILRLTPRSHQTSTLNQIKSRDYKKDILDWLNDAKPTLMLMGIHVKNMIREAKTLTEYTAQSKGSIEKITSQSAHLNQVILDLENSLMNPEDQNLSHSLTLMGQLKSLVDLTIQESDEVLHTYENAFKATRGMSEHITKTTETLSVNARMLQSLREKTTESKNDQKNLRSIK